jgi:hypothetical protein
MKVFCYPVAHKAKSLVICEAFAKGCGGEVIMDGRPRDGAAMFYGVNESNAAAWEHVRRKRLPFYYADNSYFDVARGKQLRITRNRLQHNGHGLSSGARLDALGVQILPPRAGGDYFLEVEQSPLFMRYAGRYGGDWCSDVLLLRGEQAAPRRRRPWSPNKPQLMDGFARDLIGASCVVTHSSAAAVEAVLAGVRVITSLQSAAWCFSRYPSPDIIPDADDRRRWASVLADNQWTLDEIAAGTAWRALNA